MSCGGTAVTFFFISLPSKKRSINSQDSGFRRTLGRACPERHGSLESKKMPLDSCIYPHQSWKSGAKQSRCFAFIPSSIFCFGAAIAGGRGSFRPCTTGRLRTGEILFDTLKGSLTTFGVTEEWFTHDYMTLLIRALCVLRGELAAMLGKR